MFFFIGGIQPKTVTLDEAKRLCPSCGLAQARLKRVDHYLSLFFIPLIPVKRGEPMLVCERCSTVSSPETSFQSSGIRFRNQQCPECGSPLEKSFRYCPHCGAPIE